MDDCWTQARGERRCGMSRCRESMYEHPKFEGRRRRRDDGSKYTTPILDVQTRTSASGCFVRGSLGGERQHSSMQTCDRSPTGLHTGRGVRVGGKSANPCVQSRKHHDHQFGRLWLHIPRYHQALVRNADPDLAEQVLELT